MLGLLARMFPKLEKQKLFKLIQVVESLNHLIESQSSQVGVEQIQIAFHHIPQISEKAIISCAKLMLIFPELDLINDIIPVAFPWQFIIHSESLEILKQLFLSFSETKKDFSLQNFYILDKLNFVLPSYRRVDIQFNCFNNNLKEISKVSINNVPSGYSIQKETRFEMNTIIPHESKLISSMVQSHCCGYDLLVCGLKGQGKTFITRIFSKVLSYEIVESLFLYKGFYYLLFIFLFIFIFNFLFFIIYFFCFLYLIFYYIIIFFVFFF